jgi:prolipoprotein diacylglyceryltransferase
LVLTLIFSFRFFVEFLKERQVDFEANMSLDMGQLLSVPFIVTGLYFMFIYKKKPERYKAGRP